MDWSPWIHFAHIGGAVVWLGGGLTLSLVAVRVRRTEELSVMREFARTQRFLGLTVFAPAVIVVLVAGILLVLQEFDGDFTRPWIALGIGALVVAFLIGALYLGRSALRMERLGREGDLEGARQALGAWLAGYAVVVAILVFALWDMVFKPGT
jgi:uncharacterized membrane protein